MQPHKISILIVLMFLMLSLFVRLETRKNIEAHATTIQGSMVIYALYDTETYFWGTYNNTIPNIFANQSQIQIGEDDNESPNGQIRQGWFKFNITEFKALYGANITFTSATLRFFCFNRDVVDGNGQPYNLTFAPHSIDPAYENSWTDLNLTWAGKPNTYTFSEATNSVNVTSSPAWYYWAMRTGDGASGVGALQDCYDNNMTKTYVLTVGLNASGLNQFIGLWNTKESVTWPALEINFEQTLMITVDPVINVQGNGTATLFPSNGPYLLGSTIYASASAGVGSYFVKFQRNGFDVSPVDNPHGFADLQDSEIFTAVFSLNPGTYNPTTSGGETNTVSLPSLPIVLAYSLGMPGNTFAGGILAMLIIMVIFMLPTLFVCNRYNRDMVFPSLFVGFGALCFSVALGFVGYWILLVIALVVALMFAGQMRDWITGKQ